MVVGRKSQYSLYDDKIASFEDDGGLYDQKDAAGFIKLQALRLRTLATNRGSTAGVTAVTPEVAKTYVK